MIGRSKNGNRETGIFASGIVEQQNFIRMNFGLKLSFWGIVMVRIFQNAPIPDWMILTNHIFQSFAPKQLL
jgi:hypothetical protein